MAQSQPSSGVKQRFQGWFWWTAPIGLIADIWAIYQIFREQQQYQAAQTAAAGAPVPEPRILSFLSINDAFAATFFIAVLLAIIAVYYGYERSRNHFYLPLILSLFLVVVVTWIFLRIWQPEYWWIFVLGGALSFLIIAGFPLSSFQGVSVNLSPNWEVKILVVKMIWRGCIVSVAIFACMFLFATGIAERARQSAAQWISENFGKPQTTRPTLSPDNTFPTPPALQAPPISAETFIQYYYATTDKHDYKNAWNMLSPYFQQMCLTCEGNLSPSCKGLVGFFDCIEHTEVNVGNAYSQDGFVVVPMTLHFIIGYSPEQSRNVACSNDVQEFVNTQLALIKDTTGQNWLIDRYWPSGCLK
ncbi:MAG: hypothetical protein HY870_24165 [Chloroflexi bacterium]|nr:hypothetical protein [Chloroflexota bacterium]